VRTIVLKWMSLLLSILLVALAILPGCTKPAGGAAASTPATMITSATTTPGGQHTALFTSDYYGVFANADSTLKFVNKTTSALILDNASSYYLNYGNASRENLSPPNSSFETDSNSPGIPDGWTLDKTYIRQSSDYASDGTRSLKFNLAAPDSEHRRATSAVIPANPDESYSVSIDTYLSNYTSGVSYILILYYPTPDGSGAATATGSLISLPVKVGSWITSSFPWNPPLGVRSFRIMIYSDKDTIATIYFDNLKVTKIIRIYETGRERAKTQVNPTADGAQITIVDDSSPEVTVTNKYDLKTHSPNIVFTSSLKYKKDVFVSEERYDFTIPTLTASVMTRDLQLIAFDKTKEYYSDLYTPKVAKFDNGISLLGTDTMQSMRLRANGDQSQLSFYSDYNLNHSFFYYTKGGYGSQTDISSQKRLSGEQYDASIIFMIDPGVPAKSLVKTRQPFGYDAALVFTNHADDETAATISAVAYGTEDASGPDYGKKGIASRGLGWTKSVFVSGQVSPYMDLSNPIFKTLTDKLSRDGVEIVGHSITPDTDSRNAVDAGLKVLSQYGARDWIDHGAANGDGNFEDLASQGTVKGSPNYILDIFAKYGYQYAWSYIDFPAKNYDLNMLTPARTEANTSFFYYNINVDDNPGHDARIYLWSTINTNKTPDLYYATANVDLLISQKGIHIGHEYVGNTAAQNHAWWVNPVTRKKEIFPAFDNELTYIASKRDSGLLWTPTMAQLGDYLALLPNVLITDNADGTYLITNHNSQLPISGLTLLAESDLKSVAVGGQQLSSLGGSYSGNKIILPTLAPEQSIILTIAY
jgi:hypothetical protein